MWVPYLESSKTLVAFIVMLGSFVLLGVLRVSGVDRKLVTAIAAVFIIGSVVALGLAVFSVSQENNEVVRTEPKAANVQPDATRVETAPVINFQMSHGSNNVLINNQGRSK